MAIQLRSTVDAGFEDGVNVLVYGKVGVGKTRLMLTAPNPVIFATERGLLSLRDHNLPFVEIDSTIKLEEALTWAEQSTEFGQFETACLDSLTELAEIILLEQTPKFSNKMQVYGAVLIETMKYVRRFKKLKKNCYLSAKETDDRNAANQFFSKIDMPGKKLDNAIPGDFDLSFQLTNFLLEDGSTKAYLKTFEDPTTIGLKDRSGALDPWEEPNLTNIFNKIFTKRG